MTNNFVLIFQPPLWPDTLQIPQQHIFMHSYCEQMPKKRNWQYLRVDVWWRKRFEWGTTRGIANFYDISSATGDVKLVEFQTPYRGVENVSSYTSKFRIENLKRDEYYDQLPKCGDVPLKFCRWTQWLVSYHQIVGKVQRLCVNVLAFPRIPQFSNAALQREYL